MNGVKVVQKSTRGFLILLLTLIKLYVSLDLIFFDSNSTSTHTWKFKFLTSEGVFDCYSSPIL